MLQATAAIQLDSSPPTDRSWAPTVGVVATAVGSIAVMALVAVVLVQFRDSLMETGGWGYAGVFLAELGNTVVILVPTPAHAYTFAMGAALNPWALGLIGGTGAALGELTGYYLGLKSRRVVAGGRLYERMRSLTARWTGVALFTFATLPVPFDVAGFWAGSLKYPAHKFILYVLVGKTIKVTGIALAGYYGATWLLGSG
jgi:membrane protein DedA with SNARE-associated domain